MRRGACQGNGVAGLHRRPRPSCIFSHGAETRVWDDASFSRKSVRPSDAEGIASDSAEWTGSVRNRGRALLTLSVCQILIEISCKSPRTGRYEMSHPTSQKPPSQMQTECPRTGQPHAYTR